MRGAEKRRSNLAAGHGFLTDKMTQDIASGHLSKTPDHPHRSPFRKRRRTDGSSILSRAVQRKYHERERRTSIMATTTNVQGPTKRIHWNELKKILEDR